jgi:hypothetical protein
VKQQAKIVSISYRQFCRRVRTVARKNLYATNDELLAEWNRALSRYGDIDYEAHARRIEARRDKVECPTCGEPFTKEIKPAVCGFCDGKCCTLCLQSDNGTCCCPSE